MKKALLMVVCMVLVAALAVAGTVAYFTDREEVVNVMTAGNVQIQLNEQQRDGNGGLEDFEQNKVLMPIVGSAQGEKDAYGMPVAKNYVDKIVTVTNTGKSDAYVRVLVGVPAALEGATANENALHWNLGNKFAPAGDGVAPAEQYSFEVVGTTTIDGILYNVYAFNYDAVLEPGATTTAAFVGFYLDSNVDFDGENYTINGNVIDYDLSKSVALPVMAQAVQVSGFDTLAEAFAASGLPVNPWGEDSFALVNTNAELQAALDNAEDGAVIVFANDIEGDVTVTQKLNVKITINGNGNDFAGVLTVDGKSKTYTTAGLTIKNVNFVADSISADACIRLGDGTNATRYTCNVTVDNCTFDVPGAVGVKSYTGGDKNLVIKNSTATANAHSLVQAKGIDGILVKNCDVYSKNGLNFNNSDNVTVSDCTVNTLGYAVRFGESSGGAGYAETYLIENSSLKSACDDGDAVIILRGTADYATLTLVNTTIEGTIEITNTATGATVVK